MKHGNAFEVFNIPITFAVDLRGLEARYINIQRDTGDQDQLKASQAYETLRDPKRRGVEILKAFGIELNSILVDEVFLHEIFELHADKNTKILSEISCTLHAKMTSIGNITTGNIRLFADTFARYKYTS